jgi:hypothetical protein
VTRSHDAAKEAILQHFQRRHRPVYVGEAACVIGWGLNDTQRLFAELVLDGRIRPADIEERTKYDIRPTDAAFVLRPIDPKMKSPV